MREERSVDRVVEAIAHAPVDNNAFTTHFQAVLKIKEVLNAKNPSFRDIVEIVSKEPVLASQLLHKANVAANPGNQPIRTLTMAVMHLGMARVKEIGVSVAYQQLSATRHLLPYASVTRRLWLNTVCRQTSAEWYIRALTDMPVDEGSLRSLLSNIGAFYLLNRIALQLDLANEPERMIGYLARFSGPITNELVTRYGLTNTKQIKLVKPNRGDDFSLEGILTNAWAVADVISPWGYEDGSVELIPALYADAIDTVRDVFATQEVSYA